MSFPFANIAFALIKKGTDDAKLYGEVLDKNSTVSALTTESFSEILTHKA